MNNIVDGRELRVAMNRARQWIGEHEFTLLIGDECLASGRARLEAEDPTTETTLTDFPVASRDDVDRAVRAATQASQIWSRRHWLERAEALRTFADVIDAHGSELACLDTLDAGLPIRTALADVRQAARALRYVAALGGEIVGRAHPWTPDAPSVQTAREPYGVVGKIVPFNHPVKFAIVKSAAALIAGNSVIVKPSEHTSLSALRLAELAREGLAPGLVTVLPGGAETGEAIVNHPGVPRLSFTGSAQVGAAVMRGAASQIKHVTLELGGKNPMLVFPDADPAETARAAVAGLDLYRSPGQACWSTSRVLLHRSLRAPFLAALDEAFDGVRVGDPADPETHMGPLAYRDHYGRVLELVNSGVTEGAELRRGGQRPPGAAVGHFLQPTLFTGVYPGMRIAREEIFGPVLVVIDWDDDEDVVALANDTPYGLTASVWSGDLARAQSVARRLEAGLVWINSPPVRPAGTPFGGYKKSGIGRENTLEDLLSYTQEKAVITGAGAR